MAVPIGHVAPRPTNIKHASKHCHRTNGLSETERVVEEVLLSANEAHREVQLIFGDAAALDHIGLEVESAEELADVSERVCSAGPPRRQRQGRTRKAD
jgi:hypothetical protein